MNNRRLLQEYKKYRVDKLELSTNGLINLYPKTELDLNEWCGIIKKDDMIWVLDIKIPLTYPSQPPTIKFSHDIPKDIRDDDGIIMTTPPVHENINFHTGEICLDVISNRWTPLWSLSSACLAILILLDKGDESSPLNIDILNLRKCNDDKLISSLQNYYKYKNGIRNWK